jgi:hypothetical protein
VLVPLGNFLVATLAPVLEVNLANALVVFEAALSVAGDTIVYIIEQATNWINLITALFTGDWQTAWDTAGEIVKTKANFMIECMETALNAISKIANNVINFIIDGLNKISVDIPDWVPEFGGESFGINIKKPKFEEVKIPRLAQGAVIPANREFLAVLGDQKHGTNIEAPLQTIVDAFNIALANGGGNNGNTTVVLEMNGREFGHAVLEQGQRESKRLGTRMVLA